MLNRTATTLGRNATTPLSPVMLKLEPEQRMRLMRSSQKVSQVLGVTPLVDVVSPTAVTFTPPAASVTPRTAHTPLGGVRSFVAQHSPAAFINSVASKTPSYEEALKSPVLQYKINASRDSSSRSQANAFSTAARPRGNSIRRKHIPAALPLPQARRTEALPLSPFRYGMLQSTHTGALSPLSPGSAFSPITDAKIEQAKIEKLEKLETLARCATVGMPQEFIYPSFGQVEEKAEKITTFLDLYRMRAQDDGALFRSTTQRKEDAASVRECSEPESPGVRRTSRRMSRASPTHKRRSRSAGDYYSFADALEEMQSPRFAVQQKRRFSGLSRALQSPTYTVPSPPPTAMHPYSTVASPSVYSQASAECDGDVPVIVPSPSPPASPLSPGHQRAHSISRAKAMILGADARLMADFRTGFGTRPLDFSIPLFPAPLGPLPSPPVSPSLADVMSPRVPYWPNSSFRPRDSIQALQLVDPSSNPRRSSKRSSRTAEATPRTVRFQRRMGWRGQWNQGNIAGMIDSLKEL